jgi:quinoprotein glucose dehydrogenase
MKRSTLMLAGLAAIVASTPALAQTAKLPVNQWPSYGQNRGGSNFSPLTQITPANVAKLKPAWTYHYGAGSSDLGDMGLDYRFEVQPLIIGGVMYISTPASTRVKDLKATVTALVPETGKVLWKYESPRNIHGRGLAYWPGDGKNGPRLFFGTNQGYLMALDMKTGKLAEGFGDKGGVDAYIGVVSEKVGESRRNSWAIPNPAAVYKNLIITGARPGESGPPQPRGDIRAWDAVTGKLVWTFHTVPQAGEPFADTYKNGENLDRSGANNWSTMTVDEKNGIVFAPLGDLNGRADGPELFSSTLVALDAATGKLKWHQQTTHKDLYDWDLPVSPVLIDVKKDGKIIPAVAQASKQGLLFTFERLTGKPIHGLEERPSPKSDDPADIAWPTQPFPVRPGPLARVSMTRDEIANVTPEQHKYCTDFWDENKIVSPGLYARPMLNQAVVTFPASSGSPNWGGPSFNPLTGLYVVNVQNTGSYRAAGPAGRGFGVPAGQAPAGTPAAPPPPRQQEAAAVPAGEFRQAGFQYRIDANTVLPCAPTPWGELVGVDMNKGEIVWRKPLGMTEALGDKGEATGARNLGGNIQTASGLIFIGATNDRRFRAFDAKTGAVLWTTTLDASGHATPITYMGKDGKQYVVIASSGGTAIGGRRLSDSLSAFALP